MMSGEQGEAGSSLPVVMTERDLVRREGLQDRWWAAGLWAWGAAVVGSWGVMISGARTLARVGGVWVAWWHLGVVLGLVGVACLSVAFAVTLRTAALRRAELRILPRRRRTARRVGTLVAAVVLATTLGMVWLLVGDARVTALEPASPSGCVLVVEESSGLKSGWGRVGTLSPGGVLPRWQGTYSSDDGYRPFTLGAWDLRWAEGVGTLTLIDPSEPMGPERWDVTC